jgi:hypothetical protein
MRTGHPHQARGPRSDIARVDADAAEDRVAAPRAFDQRNRIARAGEGRIVLRSSDDGRRRIEADEHAVRAQMQCGLDAIGASGKIQGAMAVDGGLQRGGVVGCAVALHAEIMHVDPLRHGRKRRDIRSNGYG